MNNKLLVANFKMNKTFSETKEYFNIFKDNYKSVANKKIVFCLPYTSLQISKNQRIKNVFFGAQNISGEEKGAYTGEISAVMLKEAGVKFVIIGHSECRKHFNENNEQINKKIKIALRYGFEIILCVGETRVQKNTGKTSAVIQKQISEALSGIYENELKSITIAYEPIWAVGTGKVADNRDVTKAVQLIKQIVISKLYSPKVDVKVIYGGSLTLQSRVIKNKNVDGFLVGGASLDPYDFLKIINKI